MFLDLSYFIVYDLMVKNSKTSVMVYYAALSALIVSAVFLYWGNYVGAYGQVGLLEGKIVIVAPCPMVNGTASCESLQLYSSKHLSLQPLVGPQIDVDLDTDGRFFAYMPVGTYTLNLSQCWYAGCSQYFPQQITIKAAAPTVVEAAINGS